MTLLEMFSGKVLASVFIATSYALVSLSWITAGLAARLHEPHLAVPVSLRSIPSLFAIGLVIPLLMVILVILISSQSRTLRAAQSVVFVPIVLLYVPTFAFAPRLLALAGWRLAALLIGGLTVAVLLLWIAAKLFRPDRQLLQSA